MTFLQSRVHYLYLYPIVKHMAEWYNCHWMVEFLDANVIVRYITNDQPSQAARAKILFDFDKHFDGIGTITRREP